MQFEILSRDGLARRGRLTFAHGSVETPVFMPVGTYGSVKAMTPEDLRAVGAQIVLGNTFHLWLRPGLDVIAAHGGLHRVVLRAGAGIGLDVPSVATLAGPLTVQWQRAGGPCWGAVFSAPFARLDRAKGMLRDASD